MIINYDITFIIFTFSGNYGHCLNSKPLVNHLLLKDRHSKLPGEYFDENQQCEFVFGNGSRICSYMVSCSCEIKTIHQGRKNSSRFNKRILVNPKLYPT